MTGSFNWDYTVQDNRIKKLYELGKQLNWNVEVDVDWTQVPGIGDEEFEFENTRIIVQHLKHLIRKLG